MHQCSENHIFFFKIVDEHQNKKFRVGTKRIDRVSGNKQLLKWWGSFRVLSFSLMSQFRTDYWLCLTVAGHLFIINCPFWLCTIWHVDQVVIYFRRFLGNVPLVHINQLILGTMKVGRKPKSFDSIPFYCELLQANVQTRWCLWFINGIFG